jgi:predicted glycoside hydrolase/deacetylase ChbG (UPF0249 family)
MSSRADRSPAAGATRRIWLCADDYGISASVSTAIRDLVVRGRLNATSAMVVAPDFYRSEAISLALLNTTAQRVAIGLHVTLTGPFRPLVAEFRPLQAGAFLPLARAARHAFIGRYDRKVLIAEISSQFDRFLQFFGRGPDFIDGHHHVHLFPQIRDAVLEVAKLMAPQAWLRQCARALPLRARLADRKGLFLDFLSRRFRRRVEALGLRTNPAFAGTYEFTEGANFAALFPRFLEGLPDGGLVMCHPGFVGPQLRALDSLTTLREREYAYLASDAFPQMLAEHGVVLA